MNEVSGGPGLSDAVRDGYGYKLYSWEFRCPESKNTPMNLMRPPGGERTEIYENMPRENKVGGVRVARGE